MEGARDHSRSPVPKDAKEVVVSGLGGESWKIMLGCSDSVSTLRHKVAKASNIPAYEVALACGEKRLADEQKPLEDGGELGEVQLVRMRAAVPELEKLKEFLTEHEKYEVQGEEWIQNDCHRWTLFQGNPVSKDTADDWEEKYMLSGGDPYYILKRYDLTANPDVHVILAKFWLGIRDGYGLEDERLILREIRDWTTTLGGFDYEVPEEFEKEFYPPDSGKEGCKTYSLFEHGNLSIAASVSPGWVYTYYCSSG